MIRARVLLSMLCIVVFVFLAVGSGDSDSEPTKSSSSSSSSSVSSTSSSGNVNDVVKLLEDSFSGLADVQVDQDDQIYIIIPTDPDLVDAFLYVAMGDPSVTKTYKAVLENMRDMSTYVNQVTPGYSVVIANPLDHSKVLAAAFMGVIIYDFTDDL